MEVFTLKDFLIELYKIGLAFRQHKKPPDNNIPVSCWVQKVR